MQAVEVDADAEALRSAVEHAAKDHADDHFPAGVSTVCTCVSYDPRRHVLQVYAKGDEVIVCIEDHKFNPGNYWNGRWRSEWSVCLFVHVLVSICMFACMHICMCMYVCG